MDKQAHANSNQNAHDHRSHPRDNAVEAESGFDRLADSTAEKAVSSGKPLTRGALAGLQRQIGNRAVQRLLSKQHGATQRTASAHGKIQRNVGFEFEVGSYPAEKLTHAMTAEQRAGTEAIPRARIDPTGLTKGRVLGAGPGFEMQVDQGANDFHLEFVTTGQGFAETKAGRAQLKTALEGMVGMGKDVMAKVGAKTVIANTEQAASVGAVDTGRVTGGTASAPETIIRGTGTMQAEPQTTAGIRLDQIPALMENMMVPTGEAAATRQKRESQRIVLSGKSNTADRNAMRDSSANVKRAIAAFKDQMQEQRVALSPNFGSPSLEGLMGLIYTYLKKAATPVGSYPKALFPLLGITNFAQMYNMLPMSDKLPFTAVPQRFVDINLDAAQFAGTGATAFFAGGFAERLTNMTADETAAAVALLNPITRTSWLSNIPQGSDQLTQAVSHTDTLESMGRLNRGEQVGTTHLFKSDTVTTAPIMELRRMQGHVSIHNWKDLALDVYDFIVKLNDKTTTTFKKDRYDRTRPKTG